MLPFDRRGKRGAHSAHTTPLAKTLHGSHISGIESQFRDADSLYLQALPPSPSHFLTYRPHHSPTAGTTFHCSGALGVSYLQALAQAVPSAGTLLSSRPSFMWLNPAHSSTSTLIAPPPEAVMSPSGAPSVQDLLLPTPRCLATCLSSAHLHEPREQKLSHHWSPAHSARLGHTVGA